MFHPNGPSLAELAEQALSETTAGYDLLAPKFEFTPFRTPEDILQVVAEHIGPPGGVARGLDLCCGTGAALAHLKQRCSQEVLGVDLSAGMLEQARERLESAPGDARFSLEQGDVLEHPLPQDHFDVVTCFGAFGHILEGEQEERFVRQVHRALKPGGRFLFVTSGAPDNLSWRVWAARAFNAAIHARNAVRSPPFHMYYLTFRLPRAQALLEAQGFSLDVEPGLWAHKYKGALLVTATKR
ncbi:MAG: class I SAM-dependent methyltransferase [Myxococcota bacterium]|nr:class I SAM-dependent methyltransferase [Myxococcota bacterium]